MRSLFYVTFIFLILLPQGFAFAEETDRAKDGCEVALSPATTTTELWAELATGAKDETVYSRGPGRTTPPHIVTLRERELAAEALLMLIFDHKILTDAARRTTTTEEELRNLFHVSGAFSLPPLKKYRSWNGRDKTGFENTLLFIKQTSDDPSQFVTKPNSQNDSLVEWQEYLLAIAEDEYEQKITPQQIQRTAETLVSKMKYTWATFTNSRVRKINSESKYPQVRFTKDYLAFAPGDLYGGKTIKDSWKTSFRIKKFAALSAAELNGFPLEQEGANPTVHKLIMNYLKIRLHDVLVLREQILAEANGDVGKNREALLKSYSLRNTLRDEILDLAQGKPLQLPESKLSLITPRSVLSDYLPLLRPQKPLIDFAHIDSTIQQIADDRQSPMKMIRLTMREIDRVMDSMPTPVSVDRLKDWQADPNRLESWLPKLQEFLGGLEELAQEDLETIQDIYNNIQKLNRAVAPRFTQVQDHLSQSTLSPLSQQSTLDDARLQKITMAQSRAVARLRLERQAQWLTLLTKLQTLARQYSYQLTLGENPPEMQRELTTEMTNLLNFKASASKPSSWSEML